MTENPSIKPKVEFLKKIFLFVGFMSLGLGLYRYQDNAVMGYIDFLLAASIFALCYYLNNHKDRIEIISSIALALSYLFFTAIYLLAPYNKTRIALYFLLLASVFFLKGKKAGFIWLIIILLTFIIVHFVPGFETAYSGLEIITGSLFLVGGFFIFYNYEMFIENASRHENEQLRISDELLRQSQSVAKLGSWRLSQQDGILHWSEEIYRLFGIPVGTAMTYDLFLAHVYPDDRAMLDLAWQAAMTNGGGYFVQHRIVVNGKTLWIEERANLNFDAQGNFRSGTGYAQDITERKQLELAQQEVLDRFQKITQLVPGAIYQFKKRLDGSFCMPYVSDACYDIFRLSPAELLEDGSRALMRTHPDDLEDLMLSIQASARDMTPWQHEYRLKFDDGTERWVYGNSLPQQETDGSLLWHGFITDITDRKLAEELLQNSFRQMEEKELAKTRFLAAAGHDLRQPIAAANLFVDALKFSAPTPRQSKLIERLDQSMSIFSGLLERLLDISKFDAGLVKPQFASYNLSELFIWLEQNFAQAALDKGLRFRLYFSMDRSLIVRTDIVLLQSVLMNLISNAIKFTARGGILVSARQRGDKVLLQVWDTGMGISEPDLLHIFDEFYQVANPQRSREAGLGLGLSICQRTMSLLGGEVTCRSRVGRGSVFELSLPLNGKPREIAPLPIKNISNQTVSDTFLYGKRLVVLEDDALVADGMINLLEGLGAKVQHFHNAEDALQYDELTSTDYFIVDYALGSGLNGIQFLNAVQQKQQIPLRAIVVTGETSSEFIGNTMENPWAVLHKPITYAKLVYGLHAS